MRILQYAKSHPRHKLVFRACDMVLYIISDASYLSRSNARSVAGSLFYCGNYAADPLFVNGALLAVSSIIPTVCTSVAEAEYASAFIAAQRGIWLRQVLTALGYPQLQATSLVCDNACAVGIATDSVKIKRSKTIDMRYHWLRDRVRLSDIAITWSKGSTNLADFFTKALPVHRFRELKPLIVSHDDNPHAVVLSKRVQRSQAFSASRRHRRWQLYR
jgi:hypothetical protein